MYIEIDEDAAIVKNEESLMPEPEKPLIFISHDARDAELAEAFSQLLTNVSAGVLKSFRFSDRKGAQGIEYGAEWYPELMKQLEAASDVVCLLTPMSLGRPWILFEAGVAKGGLAANVFGVALGVPVSKANTGPFTQFQNCGDSEDELTKLVMQLVNRIPDAEPDQEAVLTHVQGFKAQVRDALANQKDEAEPAEEDGRSDEALGETLWSRTMPRLDLGPPDTVAELRRVLERIRESACDRVKRIHPEVTLADFRVHVVLPDYSQCTELGTYQLFLPDELKVGDHEADAGLKVWPGQGLAGRAFVQELPEKTRISIGGDGGPVWSGHYEYTETHKQSLPEDLRWLVAIPLRAPRGDNKLETMGVLAIQGRKYELSDDQIDALIGFLLFSVMAAAAWISMLSHVRLTIIKEEVANER